MCKHFTMDRNYTKIVHYAIQAPSSHNTQPWKFRIEEDRIFIHPDYSRALEIADFDNHELFISLGCALENLVIAARHFNYYPMVHIQTEGDVFIEVKLQPLAQSKDDKLFEQIEIRQSTRNVYNGRLIPPQHVEVLRSVSLREGVGRYLLTEKNHIEPVIELVREASLAQYSNENYVDELLQWIRFNEKTAIEKLDGVFSGTVGRPSVPGWLGKIVVAGASPKKQADRNEQLIRSSSGLVIFTAIRNDVLSWINAGRCFERFALTATSLGIHHAHMNMPCEVASSRQKLARFLNLQHGEQPVLMVRIGYSSKMPYSYRRPAEQVLTQVS